VVTIIEGYRTERVRVGKLEDEGGKEAPGVSAALTEASHDASPGKERLGDRSAAD
jgi:hypothetical protein